MPQIWKGRSGGEGRGEGEGREGRRNDLWSFQSQFWAQFDTPIVSSQASHPSLYYIFSISEFFQLNTNSSNFVGSGLFDVQWSWALEIRILQLCNFSFSWLMNTFLREVFFFWVFKSPPFFWLWASFWRFYFLGKRKISSFWIHLSVLALHLLSLAHFREKCYVLWTFCCC